MGRLDNIITRNRRTKRMPEKVIVSMLIGLVVLLILALAVFTDLGLPPEARNAPAARDAPAAPSAAPRAPASDHGRVDGVLLRRSPPPPKPASPGSPASPAKPASPAPPASK